MTICFRDRLSDMGLFDKMTSQEDSLSLSFFVDLWNGLLKRDHGVVVCACMRVCLHVSVCVCVCVDGAFLAS